MRHTRPSRDRLRARRTRGFTVIEIMLALALSAVVLAAALGLYRILHAAEVRSEERFEQAADLAVTQMTLRRIMNTLVCAPPDANNPPTGAGNPAAQNDNADTEGTADEGTDQSEGDESDADASDRAATLSQAAPTTPIMFDLAWTDMDFDDTTISVPSLEIVVSEAPVALTQPADQLDDKDLQHVNDAEAESAMRRANRLAESVRGVIEAVPDDVGWRLQWRPTDPPALPFLLVRHIGVNDEGGPAMLWEVLSRDEKNTDHAWQGVWAAKIHDEFPQAVRLRFETVSGEYTDWLFETHDSVQE